jgi:hypothetical protein
MDSRRIRRIALIEGGEIVQGDVGQEVDEVAGFQMVLSGLAVKRDFLGLASDPE